MPSVNPGPSNSSTVNTQPVVGSFDNSGNLVQMYGPNNVPVQVVLYSKDASGNVNGLVGPNGAAITFYPKILQQGGVPVYILPSGSVGANGAITLGTALAVTESGGLWGYLPAGAAYSASVAGFYWIVMSSTTAGTIFNNIYIPGVNDFRIPSTTVAVVDAGPGAYTGTTAEVTAVSVSLPGGSLGANGSLTTKLTTSSSGGAGTKTTKSKLGTVGGINSVVTTANYSIAAVCTLWNRGIQTAQSRPVFGSDITSGSANTSNWAVDTTVAQPVSITLQNSAPATDYISLQSWTFETRYQP